MDVRLAPIGFVHSRSRPYADTAAASIANPGHRAWLAGDAKLRESLIVRDIGAYDAFYKRLIAAVPLQDVSSSFAMEQIKFTTALPI